MRRAFISELTALAARDERVMLLTGDLGFSVLEGFGREFPDRFINCGVAEQNMTGVATGLAEAGYVPFVYSIATFASLRPYEFIRNGPVLHGLPVRIVGVGGGFDYGHNGITHFALEDYAVMRVQPDLGVVSPADADSARAAVIATADESRPLYFRISKRGHALPGLNGRFRMGRAEVIGDGRDVAIICIGSIAHEAVEAADQLADSGVGATVVVVSSFNPSPDADLARILESVPLAVTLEAHYRSGGLGSLVCETIADHRLSVRLIRAAVDEMPAGQAGSQAYLEDRFGLSAKHVVRAVAGELAGTS